MTGGIEAGGTKWTCAIGTGPNDLDLVETFATTTPAETIGHAVEFFERAGPVDAIGIGCFGPVDVDAASPTWGYITSTPKPGWANTDVAPEIRRRLAVPVAFDTDVNAAALGEQRWGTARGLDTFCYITIGTGIGGGAVAGGRLVHGLLHPEFGHIRIPHDRAADPFAGACPYHGDCWEGLAAGPAIEARWGQRAEELLDRDDVWALEADYVALGIVCVTCVLSPQRVIVGGGVGSVPGLLDRVHPRVDALLNGYLDLPAPEEYVVAPGLGPRSGVLGAIALAESL
ncbi:MAG TPA: ROK family protein [Gaiellaceae bacterium]|nr:ROK family protein [Gaiellaceae bacterium]